MFFYLINYYKTKLHDILSNTKTPDINKVNIYPGNISKYSEILSIAFDSSNSIRQREN